MAEGFVSPSDCVGMDKGEMRYIRLIFFDPQQMGFFEYRVPIRPWSVLSSPDRKNS